MNKTVAITALAALFAFKSTAQDKVQNNKTVVYRIDYEPGGNMGEKCVDTIDVPLQKQNKYEIFGSRILNNGELPVRHVNFDDKGNKIPFPEEKPLNIDTGGYNPIRDEKPGYHY